MRWERSAGVNLRANGDTITVEKGEGMPSDEPGCGGSCGSITMSCWLGCWVRRLGLGARAQVISIVVRDAWTEIQDFSEAEPITKIDGKHA